MGEIKELGDDGSPVENGGHFRGMSCTNDNRGQKQTVYMLRIKRRSIVSTDGVDINSVSPGFLQTQFNKTTFDSSFQDPLNPQLERRILLSQARHGGPNAFEWRLLKG